MEEKLIVDIKELDRYLNKISSIFPVKSLSSKTIDADDIINYYRNSSAGYKYLHSNEGAVHMSINYDGTFDKEGYYTQVKEIAELISNSEVKNVLELGCGKGFNSIFLSKMFPEIKFLGIDITDEHLLIANKKSSDLENLKFTYGDFHQLDFQDSTFELIFELEAICHAKDSRLVLSEIYRVLKKHGQFILYEGFRRPEFDKLPENLIKAAILTEKSMAVNRFENIDAWLKLAQEIGFKIKVEIDLSKAIMPNLGKFQILARGYFKYPFLSKIFLKMLPTDMIMNSIAGLLMPFTLYNKAHCYYKLILEKE